MNLGIIHIRQIYWHAEFGNCGVRKASAQISKGGLTGQTRSPWEGSTLSEGKKPRMWWIYQEYGRVAEKAIGCQNHLKNKGMCVPTSNTAGEEPPSKPFGTDIILLCSLDARYGTTGLNNPLEFKSCFGLILFLFPYFSLLEWEYLPCAFVFWWCLTFFSFSPRVIVINFLKSQRRLYISTF